MHMHIDIGIVQYLHQAGADLNIRNIYGRTAVMYAAYAYAY